MPKERKGVEGRIQELERKERQYHEWAMLLISDLDNKVAAVLRERPEFMYDPKELFEMVFGKKECSLPKGPEDKSCQGECCEKTLPAPDHPFECDHCKHFILLNMVLAKLIREGTAIVYHIGNELWIGINPNPPQLNDSHAALYSSDGRR